jgi:hypothetical protein
VTTVKNVMSSSVVAVRENGVVSEADLLLKETTTALPQP